MLAVTQVKFLTVDFRSRISPDNNNWWRAVRHVEILAVNFRSSLAEFPPDDNKQWKAFRHEEILDVGVGSRNSAKWRVENWTRRAVRHGENLSVDVRLRILLLTSAADWLGRQLSRARHRDHSLVDFRADSSQGLLMLVCSLLLFELLHVLMLQSFNIEANQSTIFGWASWTDSDSTRYSWQDRVREPASLSLKLLVLSYGPIASWCLTTC